MWRGDSTYFSMYTSPTPNAASRSEEHTSELQSHSDLVCRLLLEKNNTRRGSQALSPTWWRFRWARLSLSPTAFFFFNDTATTEIYTLSLHDALPIYILFEYNPREFDYGVTGGLPAWL